MSQMICTQCQGYAKTDWTNEQLNPPNSTTFTDPTTRVEVLCNFCNGIGYFKGSMG